MSAFRTSDPILYFVMLHSWPPKALDCATWLLGAIEIQVKLSCADTHSTGAAPGGRWARSPKQGSLLPARKWLLLLDEGRDPRDVETFCHHESDRIRREIRQPGPNKIVYMAPPSLASARALASRYRKLSDLREPTKRVFGALQVLYGPLWSRSLTRWFRRSLSVADPFVGRCLARARHNSRVNGSPGEVRRFHLYSAAQVTWSFQSTNGPWGLSRQAQTWSSKNAGRP